MNEGIDVSEYQGDIDWDAVVGHPSFSIIKATEGNGYVDAKFTRNIGEARRLDITRGFYHFAGGLDPVAEANHFLATVGGLLPGEFVVLDVEGSFFTDVADPVGWCEIWLERVNNIFGPKPLIYMSWSKTKAYDWSTVAEHGYPLWVAHYGVPAGEVPSTGAFGGYVIHQYADNGSIPGIGGNVDLDDYVGADMTALRKLGYTKPNEPVPTPSPEPVPAPVPDPTPPTPTPAPSPTPIPTPPPLPTPAPSPSPLPQPLNFWQKVLLWLKKKGIHIKW